MQIRRCQWCKDGIPSVDPADNKFVTCALIPPTGIVTVENNEAKLVWIRPPMAQHGWCGQFKLAFWRMLKRDGART
jgi:hypothetical protein